MRCVAAVYDCCPFRRLSITMSNTGAALRRVLILTLLTITLFSLVVFLSMATNTQVSASTTPKNPVLNEEWDPKADTTLYMTSTAQLVTRMTPPTTDQFTVTNIVFRKLQPDGITDGYSVVSSTHTTLVGSYLVVTATNFPFTLPAERVQFLVTYYTASNLVPTTAVVAYNVTGVYQSYVSSVLDKFGSGGTTGNDPCSAVTALPLTDYSLMQDAPYKFFSMTIATTSTVILTSTGYPVYGQLQLRTPPILPSCAPTGSQYIVDSAVISTSPSLTVYNVFPGNYLARLSSDNGVTSNMSFAFRWQSLPGHGLFGANVNSCFPATVTLNTQVQEYPYPPEDWFAFTLTSTQNISVVVNNYTGNGQFILYHDTGTCATPQFLDSVDLSISNSGVIQSPSLPAGRYYLRVYTSGGNNTTSLYNFIVNSDYGYTPVPWNPSAERCADPSHGCGSNTTNGSETIYFFGAPGADEIDVYWIATGYIKNNVTYCPTGSSYTDVINTTTNPSVGSVTPNGSKNYSGLATGYYIVQVIIKRAGYPNYTTPNGGFGVKYNCDWPPLVLSPWAGFTATPSAPLIGPVLPPMVNPTPPPLPMDLPHVSATPAP